MNESACQSSSSERRQHLLPGHYVCNCLHLQTNILVNHIEASETNLMLVRDSKLGIKYHVGFN